MLRRYLARAAPAELTVAPGRGVKLPARRNAPAESPALYWKPDVGGCTCHVAGSVTVTPAPGMTNVFGVMPGGIGGEPRAGVVAVCEHALSPATTMPTRTRPRLTGTFFYATPG